MLVEFGMSLSEVAGMSLDEIAFWVVEVEDYLGRDLE
jgi:hypothetical protein